MRYCVRAYEAAPVPVVVYLFEGLPAVSVVRIGDYLQAREPSAAQHLQRIRTYMQTELAELLQRWPRCVS